MKHILTVVCSALLLSACAPVQDDDVVTPVGKEWVAEDINGKGVLSDSVVTMRMDADGRLGGRSGCNQYGASYTLSGERLTVSPQMISTKMACLSDSIMQQEQEYTTLLATMTQAQLMPRGRLQLMNPQGQTISYRKQ